MSCNGVVEWFSRAKGFGFVKKLDSDLAIFVHKSNIKYDGFVNLFPGEYVSFDVENKRGKGQCVNLTGFNGGNLLCQNDKYYFKVYQKRTYDNNNKESNGGAVEEEADNDSNGDTDDDADDADNVD